MEKIVPILYLATWNCAYLGTSITEERKFSYIELNYS